MTWNFDYTIPALIVLIFFLVFYFIKPVLLSQSNRCFFAFILLEVVGMFVTNYLCYADSYSTKYPRAFLIFLNNLYFYLIIARYFLISLYFSKILRIKIKQDIPSVLAIVVGVCILLLLPLSVNTGLIYEITPDGKFHKSEYFVTVYFANIACILLDTYYVILFYKKLKIKWRIALIFTVLSLIACSLMDYIFYDYLITDMFFLLVIMILFITFENSDIYLDQKTGLYNFQAFAYYVLEHLFREKKFYIITFVIKNYSEKKQIYGVKQMDLALKGIGKYFISQFHNKNCFYMQNGRFAIIDHSTDDFEKISESIVKRFEKPWTINNSELHLKIFVIDVAKDISFDCLEDIYCGYGLAYQEEKRAPDNHITIDKKLYDEVARKTKVTKALNKALLEDQLQVYFQPIIHAKTRKVVGAEALVRIHDDELGVIPPVEFISMAEKNGSIEQLGEQVLNKVCVFLKEHKIQEQGIQWVNVNLSPIQCQNINLKNKINNITNSNFVDHQFIHLEITEDSMIDYQILNNQMNVLITDGYRFSLDDFGAGFSNITRIRKFPFNNVKLDMSLILDHFSAPDNMLLRIIRTFKDRDLTVTAEGVESKEIADELELMGCDYLQGFYFSKPLPIDEFIKYLSKTNS